MSRLKKQPPCSATRWQPFSMMIFIQMLIVSFTERDDIIRIISERMAKKRERDGYERDRKR